jgi:NAD(P)-dependent dehydrogenase (short-subunit alcohol dehydrogenase family)
MSGFSPDRAVPRLELPLPSVVVVSGASSGFGLLCTQKLVASGTRVIGVDLAPGHDSVASLALYTHFQGDVADEPVWTAVTGELSSADHSLGLLTCAAILGVGSVVDLDLAEWKRVFSVNVDGTLHAYRYLVPEIVMRGGGPIVSVASVDALHAEQQLVSYCASKAAVYQLARTTALDFGRQGVRVNVLSPGPMRVGLFNRHLEAVNDPTLLATREARQPNGRILDPGEVANAALFLLSDGSSGMSGSELLVDGGLTAGYEFRTAP